MHEEASAQIFDGPDREIAVRMLDEPDGVHQGTLPKLITGS